MVKHTLITVLFLASALAAPGPQEACAKGVHIITVRETSEPLNSGLARDLALKAQKHIPGSDIKDVDYPAVWIDYFGSERKGVANTLSTIQDYVKRCSETDIILLGYSQGAQVIGDILCGADEPFLPRIDPLPADIGSHVKAAILMGDPSHVPGASFNVGNSTKHGWFPRHTDKECPGYTGIMQSYCDANDLYCDSGLSQKVHTGYVSEYGDEAVEFVLSKIHK